MCNSTERFSDRVANYIKYRPSYPQGLVDTLISQCQIGNQSIVADVGSGTGIFSKLLLDHNFEVIGVEPNESMRLAAEQQLSQYKKFSSVDGQSEKTNLTDSSIDIITAAQAFHWFKREETKKEFSRILKPEGYLALIWNQRRLDNIFQKEYDSILRKYATDYDSVNHMNISQGDIENFFHPNSISVFDFDNSQQFNLAGFLGRIQSSSYTPNVNSRAHVTLMNAAKDLFSKRECHGIIKFEYSTRLYLAQLPS